jgi:hypothetical protein
MFFSATGKPSNPFVQYVYGDLAGLSSPGPATVPADQCIEPPQVMLDDNF